MPDLEERLRESLRDDARAVAPSDRLDQLVGTRRRRRAARRRLGTGALAVATVVGLVAGGAWVVQAGGDGDGRGDGSDPVAAGAASEVSDDGGPLYLVPDPASVPEGMELLGAMAAESPGPARVVAGWAGTQRWVRFDDRGERPVEIVDVSWGTEDEVAGTQPEGVPDHLDDGTEVAWVAGTGTVYRSLPAGGSGDGAGNGDAVDAADGDAAGAPLVTAVRGVVAPAEARDAADALPKEQLFAVAASLSAREGGGVDVGRPPDGFVLVAEWPGLADDGSAPRMVSFGGPGLRGFQVLVVDDSEIPPGASLSSAEARVVTVRGNEAVSTPELLSPPTMFPPAALFLANADRYLQWVEPGGERVTISSLGMTEDEVLTVAAALQAVDDDAWDDLVAGAEPSPDPEVAAPPPEDDAPTPGDDAPTEQAAPPGPGDLHVAGTYEGLDHYALTPEGPCQLAHDDNATFTVTDGTTWALHHDQCADVIDDVWSATGTFTLTLPDGSTLTGTSTQEGVPLPTTGQPFDLDITGGTGPHADATGTCHLDHNFEEIALGQQTMHGTFTCDVSS